MARKRTTMKKVRKILQLKEAELSQRQIAEALKISRPVISEILTKCSSHGIDHQAALTLSDGDLEEMIKGKKKTTDKATTLIQSFPEMSKKLSRKGITKQYLWNEYINIQPKGVNYSQFCNLFRSWKKTTELSMHIEYKTGDKMLVDFAGHKLKIADNKSGKLKEVETYLAILGYSGLLYVEFTESQKTKDFISATENAFLYFGGVPRAVVTDNLKAAVIKASKYEPELNKQTEDFTNYYRTALLPTRGYSPKDKALVENAVTLVYQRIYASLYEKTFSTIEQLNEAARTLLEIHNNRKLSRMSVSRRELFDDTERNELRSLPTERYPLKTIITAKAAFNYHVYLPEDKHYYSIPYLYRGQESTKIYDQKNVAF